MATSDGEWANISHPNTHSWRRAAGDAQFPWKGVYVEDWQLDCCGEPFAVGSQVSWTLIQDECSWIKAILADAPVTQGTVRRIFAVCCQYARPAGHRGPQEPVPGSGMLIPVTQASTA